MPASLRLQEKFGDDLTVVFVEVQGATRDKAESFAMSHRWLGTGAMWTTERPVKSPSRYLPSFVLLSARGETLLSGNPISQHGALEAAIEDEIRRAHDAPLGTPPALKKAWKLYAEGELAKAVAEAERVAATEPDEAPAANASVERFLAGAEREVRRLERMVAEGWFALALERAKNLAGRLEGLALADAAAAVEERLASDELAAELAADRSLSALELKIAQKGPRNYVKQLQRVTKNHAGTKAGERAERLLRLTSM